MLGTLRASLEHGQIPGVNGCDTVRNGPRWTYSRPDSDHASRAGSSRSSASLWAQPPYNSGSIYGGTDGLGYPYGLAPGLVSVSRRSGGRAVGDYAVNFPGMATSNRVPLSVNVTSYGFGSDTCEVGGWGPSGNDGFAAVVCY